MARVVNTRLRKPQQRSLGTDAKSETTFKFPEQLRGRKVGCQSKLDRLCGFCHQSHELPVAVSSVLWCHNGTVERTCKEAAIKIPTKDYVDDEANDGETNCGVLGRYSKSDTLQPNQITSNQNTRMPPEKHTAFSYVDPNHVQTPHRCCDYARCSRHVRRLNVVSLKQICLRLRYCNFPRSDSHPLAIQTKCAPDHYSLPFNAKTFDAILGRIEA